MTLTSEIVEERENNPSSGHWHPLFGTSRVGHRWLCDVDAMTHGEDVVHPAQFRNLQETFENLLRVAERRLILNVSYSPATAGQPHSLRVNPQSWPISKAAQAVRQFAKQVRNTDGVKQLNYLEDEDSITVWTVVEVPLTDYDALEPIYEAEIGAMQFANAPVLDFRIVSTFQGRPIGDLVPERARAIWKR